MADKDSKAASVPNLGQFVVVERSISGVRKDKAGEVIETVTKDGKDHKAGCIVLQMRSATTADEFAKSLADLQSAAKTLESGSPLTITLASGDKQVVPRNEFVDGKNTLAMGKEIYPLSFPGLVDAINAAMQASAAAKLTAFNNTHKQGYGGGGGTKSEVDEKSIA